jgi:hypothetical protein
MASDPTRDDLIASAIASLRATVALATPAQSVTLRWTGRSVDSDGHVYIPQGSLLGCTGIVLDCSHEKSAAICDMVAACSNLAPQMLDVLEAAQAVANELDIIRASDREGLRVHIDTHLALREKLTAFAAAAAKHGGRT